MTHIACPFPENLLFYGPVFVSGSAILAAAALPALRAKTLASASAAYASLFFAAALLYARFSGQALCGAGFDTAQAASAAVMLMLAACFPAGGGMRAVFAPFFLSAAFTGGNTTVSIASLAALMLVANGAGARSLVFFAACALMLGLGGKPAATSLFILTVMLSGAPVFAFMEGQDEPEYALLSGAAAALILTRLALGTGNLIQPQAVLPVILVLAALSLFRAATEDSASGYVSGAAHSFFLLYIFYLSAGVMPGRYALMFPAAGMAAGYFGLFFARENAGSGHVIDALRYWKKGVSAKGFGLAFTVLWLALETVLLALLYLSAKPDAFIGALVFFAAAIYAVSVINRLLIIISALKHMQPAKSGAAAQVMPAVAAVLFSAMTVALIVRSAL